MVIWSRNSQIYLISFLEQELILTLQNIFINLWCNVTYAWSHITVTHTHSEKKNIAECHERKSLDVSVNSIFTPFRLRYTGYFIPCFLFVQHQFYTWLSHTHPLPKHTRHIHGNWETHGRCHKVNVHRQRKYTAIQQDMHLLHTGAEGKQTQRPWETAMCDWCEKKQIRPLMSGQYSWAKPSSHFWGKTARSVYVDAQVCVCVL